MPDSMVHLEPIERTLGEFVNGPQARAANGVLVGVETGFRIATREDREQASDTLAILRRSAREGEKLVTDSLRPAKSWLESVVATPKSLIARWKGGADAVEREMRRWDAEAERARREAEVRAQREADEAARAAAEAAKALTDDEEPLPPAQVVIPKQENIVRGAVGKDHKTRRVKAVEIMDAVACAQAWPHLLKLDTSAAKAEYDVLLKRGTADFPPEDSGIIVNGVRFVTEVSYVSGRAM